MGFQLPTSTGAFPPDFERTINSRLGFLEWYLWCPYEQAWCHPTLSKQTCPGLGCCQLANPRDPITFWEWYWNLNTLRQTEVMKDTPSSSSDVRWARITREISFSSTFSSFFSMVIRFSHRKPHHRCSRKAPPQNLRDQRVVESLGVRAVGVFNGRNWC